ncbi:MAG TPA: hypothetical protein VGF98_01300 [Candidatus Tumulicola sp.]|jgi:hypothetical protein
MLFSRKDRTDNTHGSSLTRTRDIVEIAAIVAAGIWAFYIFAYENRIKPSFAQPEVNITASLQRLSQQHGLIAVGLHIDLRNVGTVNAHFLGLAVNVFGKRVMSASPAVPPTREPLSYEYQGYYAVGRSVPVYSWSYVTHLGNPRTGVDTELDPGTSIENYRVFYVPKGKFDLLTVGIDAPYTKLESTQPTHLSIGSDGAVRVVTPLTADTQQYDIEPVTSLDVR